MAKNKGLCAICGKARRLTFEHMPPRAAYNEPATELFGIEDWLKRAPDGTMAGGHPQPQGTGLVSICKKCNEDTGAWYVPEFAKLVHAGIEVHRELAQRGDADVSPDTKAAIISISQVRPLPVLKEIVAMLLAANAPAFGASNPDLVDFVLDRNRTGLPARYQIYLVLFAGPLARFAGLSFNVDVVTRARTFVTEVAYPPFAYALTIDSPPLLPVGNISHWADAPADRVEDLTLHLVIGFGHTAFPADYRSRAAIDAEKATADDEHQGLDA